MSKITESARGEMCQIRIPGVCNHTPEKVVLCHLNGGGMAFKNPDYQSAYGCSDCHDAVDGRLKTPYTSDQLKLMHLEGVIRTQEILREKGLITIKGES